MTQLLFSEMLQQFQARRIVSSFDGNEQRQHAVLLHTCDKSLLSLLHLQCRVGPGAIDNILGALTGRLGFKTCLSKTKTNTKTQQFQDQDQDSEVPRPRPTKTKTPRFKTKTETKTCKNASRDVSRPRLKSRELQV